MMFIPNTPGRRLARLEMSRALFDEMLQHFLAVAPIEGVGLLAVPKAGRNRQATRYYPGRNIEASPTRYTMDPAQVVAALQDMDVRRWRLGAIVHSHPTSEPVPSATDLQRAFYPDALLLIFGLVPQPPTARAWQVCLPQEGVPVHPVEIPLMINEHGSSAHHPIDQQMADERGGVKVAMTQHATSPTRTAATLAASLADFPLELERALEGYGQQALVRPASDGGWGVVENLCHLRDWEEVFRHRLDAILEQDHPALPALDDDLWAIERDYRGQEPKQVLEDFRKLRYGVLERLSELPPEGWDRTGVHEVNGVVTVRWIAERLSDHCEEHLAQIRDALS